MERFGPALRRVAAELDLPRHARTDLLLELAADLEAVYAHYRDRGVPEVEAARRAEAAVLGSSDVVRRLGRLHAGPWRGWAELLGARLRGGMDLVLWSLGVLPVVVAAVAVTGWVMVERPSPLAWAVAGVAGVLAAVAVGAAIRIVGDGAPGGPALPRLLVLAAMAPAVGGLAPLLGLQRAVRTVGAVGAGGAVGGPAPDASRLVAAAAPELATFLAGLLLGIAGLLVWFVLLALDARRAAREVDALLAGGEAGPSGSPPGADETSRVVVPLVRRRHG